MDRVICSVRRGVAAFGILTAVKMRKRRRKIRRECKDFDNSCLSGIYRRRFNLAEPAEPEEVDRT